MIYIPTIEQLVEFNRSARRRLELKEFYNRNKGKVENLFVDSSDRIITAKPIGCPSYVKIKPLEGNLTSEEIFRYTHEPDYHSVRQILLERPYDTHQLGHLTPSELKIILGRDYFEQKNLGRKTTPKEMNAMWQAIFDQDSTHYGANAYLLGKEYYHSYPEIVVSVQYYHINPRRHRALKISQGTLNSRLKEIEKERKQEDEKQKY